MHVESDPSRSFTRWTPCYAACAPAGIQTGTLFNSPTHSYRAGGKPVTPISRTSPRRTVTCSPRASTAARNDSLSMTPSCLESEPLTEKQNFDMVKTSVDFLPTTDTPDVPKRFSSRDWPVSPAGKSIGSFREVLNQTIAVRNSRSWINRLFAAVLLRSPRMTIMRTYVLLAGGLLAATTAGAQARRALTFEDFAAVRGVSDPQISPDGKSVLYAVRTTDVSANKRATQTFRDRVPGRCAAALSGSRRLRRRTRVGRPMESISPTSMAISSGLPTRRARTRVS